MFLPKDSKEAGQILITFVVTLVTGYLFATAQAVPTELLAINSLLVGSYFGSSTAASATAAAATVAKEAAVVAANGKNGH